MLLILVLIPAVAGLGLVASRDRFSASKAALLAVASLVITTLLAGRLLAAGGPAEFQTSWIPSLGIHFHLVGDGLALILALLTLVLGGVAAVLALFENHERPATYQGLLLLVVAALLGVFLAADLFLFFLCFEAMLLPAVVLLMGWGRGEGKAAALRFFLYTQTGGLVMMVAITGLYFAHGRITGELTLDYSRLLQHPVTGPAGLWILGGFLVAFAIKLPLFPFQGWQPATYRAAPASLGLLLAGAMAKTGAYGFLRVVPLFPEASRQLAPALMWLGVASMIYGAVVAFGANDLRRVLAYSSLSHLGLLAAGLWSLRDFGYQGAVLQMVAHGLSVAGLFLLVFLIEEDRGHSELGRLGGLWQGAPRFGALMLVFLLASLGLPGLANFAAELLLLLGLYAAAPAIAAVAVLAPVLSALYTLRLGQRVFLGPQEAGPLRQDLKGVRLGLAVLLAGGLILLGLAPGLLLRRAPAPEAWPGREPSAEKAASMSSPAAPQADGEHTK